MNILYHPSKKCNINYSILNVDLAAGTVNYKIISGNLPIKVELLGETSTYSATLTTLGEYQFTGIENENYDFKVTDNKNCTKQESLVKCTQCPEGYAPYGNECQKVTEVQPNYYPTSFNLVKAPGFLGYGDYGALIFSKWNFNGTGTAERFALNPVNTYWANPYHTTTQGLLNKYGIWCNQVYHNQKIGFSFCFNVEKGKILYLALCVDDWATVKINGESILEQNEPAIEAQFGFRFYQALFIYPIYFPPGNNVIEIFAWNRPWTLPSANPAAFGAAIYDATKADLIAAKSDADLAGKILWTSLEMLNKPLIYEYSEGHGYHGYTCPEGYALNSCGEAVVCQLKETIDCPES